MLFHHLFYNPTPSDLFRDYHIQVGFHDFSIFNQTGIYAKLCVASFVFASGYGLETTFLNKQMNALSFYKLRFSKLYINYWFIWLLFVPTSIFVFGRTIPDAYGNHVIIKMVLDFFGLLNLTGGLSYNPTWWFYSCIIVLYLLFPILHKVICSKWLFVLATAFVITRLSGLSIVSPISSFCGRNVDSKNARV